VIHYIDTGVGPSSDPTGKSTVNGIAFATPADLDGDHITDYVYAGDVFGNVWRFDLTSSNPGSWGSPAQVFQASSASLLRPITTQVLVNTIPYNGSNGIVINFGTGRELQQTLTSAAGYAPDGQLLFGVWDWNMSVWNAKNSTQYYSMKAGTGITSGLTNLTSQTLSALTGTGAGTGYNVTANTVCYGFMSNCTGTPNPSYGWYLTLLNTQEQFLYNATLEDGFIFINSVIPPDQQKQSTSCTQLTATGYTYSLDAAAGTFSGQAAFSLNGVGTPFFVTSSPTGSGSSGGGGGPGTCTGPNCTTPPPTCTGANCTTTPTCTGGNSNITTLITQTQNGTGVAQQYSLCAGRSCACSPSARLTWLELR
jgi:type IV pilus assembly protein PilY1